MLKRTNHHAMLFDRVQRHVDAIYHSNPLGADISSLAEELLQLMRLEGCTEGPDQYVNYWSQRDAIAITYGVGGVPETFFIDRSGTIIHKENGPLFPPTLEPLMNQLRASTK